MSKFVILMITALLILPKNSMAECTSIHAQKIEQGASSVIEPILIKVNNYSLLSWQEGQNHIGTPAAKQLAQLVTKEGKLIDAPLLLSQPGEVTQSDSQRVAFNDQLIVLWQSYTANNHWDIKAVILNSTPPLRIIKSITLAEGLGNKVNPSVISHPSGFAVSWADNVDGFYEPNVTILNNDGDILHQGSINRSNTFKAEYAPGWGFPFSPVIYHKKVSVLLGNQVSIQYINDALWISWKDQSHWQPGANGGISWHFGRLERTPAGWAIDRYLKAPSPVLANRGHQFICYSNNACLFSGLSKVGRSQYMAPAIRFNPKTGKLYEADSVESTNKKAKQHSGWNSPALFLLIPEINHLNENVALHLEASTESLHIVAIARFLNRTKDATYSLFHNTLEGFSEPSAVREILTSQSSIQNISMTKIDNNLLFSFERAGIYGGISIDICHEKQGPDQ